MNPSNFPDGTPKMHLVGLSFHRNLHRVLNVFFQVCNQTVRISGLDDHVIHVGFNVSMQLIGKTHLNSALISCSCIFQTKRHNFVGVSPVWGDERGLDFILLLERNLVIS
jgi:hypothetical protein